MGGRIGKVRGEAVRRAAAAALVGVLATGMAAPARAEQRSLGEQLGLGLVAGLGSLVYFPLKMVYAFLGGFAGALTYAVTLGDEQTANAVWEPTLGGSYLITPEIVAGDEPLEFVGGAARQESGGQPKGQWD